jgi:hypothetical protein
VKPKEEAVDHEEREDRALKKAREKEWRAIAYVDDDDDESKTRYDLHTPHAEFNHEPCGRTVLTEHGEPLGFVTGLTLNELEVIVYE